MTFMMKNFRASLYCLGGSLFRLGGTLRSRSPRGESKRMVKTSLLGVLYDAFSLCATGVPQPLTQAMYPVFDLQRPRGEKVG
jgi:hypothetical protein